MMVKMMVIALVALDQENGRTVGGKEAGRVVLLGFRIPDLCVASQSFLFR